MACLCTDPAIGQELQSIAGKHRAHFNALVRFLN